MSNFSMNVDDAFQSEWLKGEDLKGREVTVTIDHIEVAEYQGEAKYNAFLVGTKKKWTLNKGQAMAIKELTGTGDMRQWNGVRVTIFPHKRMYKGAWKEFIEVKMATATVTSAAAAMPQGVQPPPNQPFQQQSSGGDQFGGGQQTDDDIPF